MFLFSVYIALVADLLHVDAALVAADITAVVVSPFYFHSLALPSLEELHQIGILCTI